MLEAELTDPSTLDLVGVSEISELADPPVSRQRADPGGAASGPPERPGNTTLRGLALGISWDGLTRHDTGLVALGAIRRPAREAPALPTAESTVT